MPESSSDRWRKNKPIASRSEETDRAPEFRGSFRGRCAVCGNQFKVGDQKIANLYEQDDRGVRREYCESCYWGTKRGQPEHRGSSPAEAFKRTKHESYMKSNSDPNINSDTGKPYPKGKGARR